MPICTGGGSGNRSWYAKETNSGAEWCVGKEPIQGSTNQLIARLIGCNVGFPFYVMCFVCMGSMVKALMGIWGIMVDFLYCSTTAMDGWILFESSTTES